MPLAFSSPTNSLPPPSRSSRTRGVEVDVKPGLDKDELAKIIGDYDGLAIRSATKVTAKLLEQRHEAEGHRPRRHRRRQRRHPRRDRARRRS